MPARRVASLVLCLCLRPIWGRSCLIESDHLWKPTGQSSLSCRIGSASIVSKDLKTKSEVDHFVPWARYPTDLGHNFVLAHPGCNNAKSDFLGALQHLQRWADRNTTKAVTLNQMLCDANLPNDLAASVRIAEWAYEQVERSQGQVWIAKDQFEHLGSEWRELLVG